MGIFQFNELELLAFVLVFFRISVFIMLFPVIGGPNIPAPVKVLSSLLIAMIVFPIVAWKHLSVELANEAIVFLAAKEIAIGFILVFIARSLFFIINIFGQIVSMSMGLSSAQSYDPSFGTQSAVIERFQLMLTGLFFLAINGHHLFMYGFVESFQIIPLSIDGIHFVSAKSIVEIGQTIFVAGVKMSAPILTSIFILNVALGLVGRAVPQINILITSFPINIMFGLFILMLSIPALLYGFKSYLNINLQQLFAIMKTI